ncbi:MAG TPA: HAMP domain-containing sensor histidine kinase, partial [Acidimicrobiales bacterium]
RLPPGSAGMRRYLVVSYLAVAAVLLVVLEIPLGVVYARHERDVASSGLQRDATAVASLAEEGVERHDPVALAGLAGHYRHNGDDVEILSAAGEVLVPARADEGEVASRTVRQRVAAVIAGDGGRVASLGDGDELIAVAPIGSAVPAVGAVVLTSPDTAVDQRVRGAWLALGALAAAFLALAAAIGALVSRWVTRPITHLQTAALDLGRGDLGARAPATRGPTEVRALSREFNDMAGRLEELVSAQRAFVADASHQLRSPLTALRLRVENVAASADAADAGDVEAVLGEMDRLSRVVDGLLLLARSEGQRPARQVVDVAEVVSERQLAWAALADEAGIRLAHDAPAGPVQAWFVPGHLDQILDNLLANAVEATPPGRSVRLEVAGADGDWVEVHVVDEGRGMAPEDRRHAFDRFWRGAGSEPGRGSGLGLAIVQQLARASGATVELRQAAGGGVDAMVRASRVRGERPVAVAARD